ncbi:MAG: hypothetical protein HRT61_01415 [Ekhidna sp.]|nr:hypothetical protein [Ekhidna sp.]
MSEEVKQEVTEQKTVKRGRPKRQEARVEYSPVDQLALPREIVEWAIEQDVKLNFIRYYRLDGVTPDQENLNKVFSEGWRPVTTDDLPANDYAGSGVNPFLSGARQKTASDKMIRRGQLVLAALPMDIWRAKQRYLETQALQSSRQYMSNYTASDANDGIIVKDESVFNES